ncbi:uncharacterized protein MONBRDRAFT_39255, partial [Monosiga brevicollis MX1]
MAVTNVYLQVVDERPERAVVSTAQHNAENYEELLDHLKLPTRSTQVEHAPHPHAVTQSGNYEYFESQGGSPIGELTCPAAQTDDSFSLNLIARPITRHLAFAIAEFVDNSLMATRHSKDRHIIVRLDVRPAHLEFLRAYMPVSRSLAYIYHYYLHGFFGNVEDHELSEEEKAIVVKLRYQVKIDGELVGDIDLADLSEPDVETCVLRSAQRFFNFKIEVPANGTAPLRVVQGQLRYHPFVQDHETLPNRSKLMLAAPKSMKTNNGDDNMDVDDAEDLDEHEVNEADESPVVDADDGTLRPIFVIYWNGRLIGNATVSSLNFCSILNREYKPNTASSFAAEVFHRQTGTLWFGTPWTVTTNKLTLLQNAREQLNSDECTFGVFTQEGDLVKSAGRNISRTYLQ